MEKDWYSLQELCELLSISNETGRNWIKAGRIQTDSKINGKCGFSAKAVKEIQKSLQREKSTRLKSRRNKSCIQGNEAYQNYLPETSENISAVGQVLETFRGSKITEQVMTALLAECALQLLYQAKGTTDIGDSRKLVEDLFDAEPERTQNLPKVQYVLEPGTDVLGFLYLSLRHAGEKKVTGAYYTPTTVVRKTIRSLEAAGKFRDGKTILDPCCGSGNFLIQFPKTVNPENIYGRDIDAISVKLTRLNLAICYPKVPANIWKEHIIQKDFLQEEKQEKYDCILGNPPWGYQFSPKEQESLKKRYQTAQRKKPESYDVFLEQALSQVKTGGTVVFVLPEALLYVKSHEKMREILLQETNAEELVYLGEVFHKVQCPSVVLRLKKTGRTLNTRGMQVEFAGEKFRIMQERNVKKNAFYFHVKDAEYRILQKLEQNSHVQYLKDHADFAMGIVTGDNQRYVTDVKVPEAEIVLKGTDIAKYRIERPKRYLIFLPEQFQQTAQEKYYRSTEKLLYRFIGKELVFARDRQGMLSLNSCNILIPHLEGFCTDYILAVLNSRLAQFVFQKKFRSVKVLRSHIEQIPIPPATEEQQMEIGNLVKKLENSIQDKQWNSLYEEINQKVAGLAGITEEEYKIIFPMQLS